MCFQTQQEREQGAGFLLKFTGMSYLCVCCMLDHAVIHPELLISASH